MVRLIRNSPVGTFKFKSSKFGVMLCVLTLYQLVNIGDLLGAVQGVDGPDALGQVDVVGQGAGQVGQQRVEGPEPVRGDGVHDPVEVAVPVAVEADLLGPLLQGQGLQGPGPVQAAVGAVRGARHPVHLGAGAAVPLTFVPLVEVLHLHLAAEAHKYGCTVCGGEREREWRWRAKTGGGNAGKSFDNRNYFFFFFF